jgi:2-polyprenyl-3-methyl-5-hydroxy-6-metoxy-1,4-benzoquinol methylase
MKEKAYRADICNICGSPDFRQVHYFKEWNLGNEPIRDVAIIQCLGCKVRRRKPEIIDEFEEEYHARYLNQRQAIHPHQLYHFADLMMVRLPQFNETNVKFLDVGCSTGRALRLAATMGFEVTGLDLSKWAVEYCSKLGFETRHGSLLGQWDQPELFDIIHCCHTIEHVPDPISYFHEMHRLLKPNGQLMLACPNYASVPRLILKDKWIWFLDSHLWQFTARQVRSLLHSVGFKVVSLRTHHGLAPRKRWKKWVLDTSASLGLADGLNIVAVRR